MKSFLLSLTVNGLKNIENAITLNFYNKTLKRFNPCGSNVKGIFGPNGIGKTAIIKGMNIISKLVINDTYLTSIETSSVLNQIINKSLKTCFIKIVFFSLEGSKKKFKYEHSIKLSNTHSKNILILEEIIQKKDYNNDTVLNEIVINNGIIIKNTFSKDKELLVEITKNLLSTRSIINILSDNILTNKKNSSYFSENDFIRIYSFYLDTKIKIDRSDEHTSYAIKEKLFHLTKLTEFEKHSEKEDLKNDNIDSEKYEDYSLPNDFFLDHFYEVIRKKEYPNFQKKLDKIKTFLKIFKSDLEEINCLKKEYRDFYFINLVMKYKDYNIDLEFESMGIKSLIELFDYFEAVYNDKIIFIDEIDLSIHDIYLNKLIEFFAKEGRGQLIFTAHNITLLETLRKYKHSIDFINENQEVIPWIKNGNSNPFRVYKDGYIKGLPFNLDESDFFNIFYMENEDY